MRTKILFIAAAAVSLVSCKKVTTINQSELLPDWTTATHSASTPDYSFFDDNTVQRFDITIDEAWWTIMQEHKDEYVASMGGGSFSDVTPIYVPCNLEHNGINWYNVGIRYKGNSSLSNSNGIGKLPFRLKFEEFVNDYPEITGQNFYGFEELSLSSNFNDKSLMREKVASDLFRDFGVPCARSVFCEIYIDYGEGPVYFGLYTVLEVVFDSAIQNEFGSNTGNCYKPDGDGASFANGTYAESYFENKTGGTDFSDVLGVYNTVNATQTNPAGWRTAMELYLNMDGYLKYMAVNFTIQNWDTYGRMTHNYYLYNDPSTGKLNWIPWDNNEAFEEGKMGGALSIDLSDASDQWPLLSKVIADPVYEAQYKTYLRDFIDNYFNASNMSAIYSNYSNLIQSSVNAETSGYSYLNSSADFSSAVSDLNTHVSQRYSIVDAYAP
ncbi:MAG: CotH kinase family protein [Crocinitomicaceae bacterium]|nr:CotH kinase family protein [Crocinitomicaceae bacterium]